MTPTSSQSFRVRLVLLCLFVFNPGLIFADDIKPIRVLLVLGGCCHDYNAQKDFLAKGIAERAHVEFVIALDKDTSTGHMNPVYEKADWADGFDVVIHDECSSDVKDLAIIDRILEPHRHGLPAVLLHCGMHSYRSEGYPKAVTPWFEFTGLQTTGHGRQAPIHVNFSDPSHPIRIGLSDATSTETSAKVTVTIETSNGDPFGGSYSETQTFRLVKEDSGWKITGIPWPTYECGGEYK
jgi:hypothetical protein